MGKYFVAVLLLILPVQSIFAQTCTDLFKQTHRYYTLGKDIQISLLDLADKLAIYPNHKGMAKEWTIYAVARYGIDAEIVQISKQDISNLENQALRDYALSVNEKFLGTLKNQSIEESQIYLTFIFNAGAPLAAKIEYAQNSAYFDMSVNPIELPFPRVRSSF